MAYLESWDDTTWVESGLPLAMGGTAKLGSRGGGPSNSSVFVRFPLASRTHIQFLPVVLVGSSPGCYGPVSWVSWVRCRVGVASFVPRLASRGTPSVGIGRLFSATEHSSSLRLSWHTAGTAGRVGLRASVSAGRGIIMSCRRPVPDTGGWLSWAGGLEGCLSVS